MRSRLLCATLTAGAAAIASTSRSRSNLCGAPMTSTPAKASRPTGGLPRFMGGIDATMTDAPTLAIRGGRVICPASGIDARLDVYVAGGMIAAVGPEEPLPAAAVVDATDLVVCPGLIDLHVHLREPGRTQRDHRHGHAGRSAWWLHYRLRHAQHCACARSSGDREGDPQTCLRGPRGAVGIIGAATLR